MSSSRRPWYPWYPKDFIVDEKVQSLSDDAELLYRRILDVLWQANDLQMLNNCTKIANAIARGWTKDRFNAAWEEVQTPGFELLKVSNCGNFIYSSRLLKEAQKIENISKTRSEAAKAKHMQSKSKAKAKHLSCHTDTDIKEIYKEKSKSILSYLNTISGKRYTPTESNLKNIIARLKEGYTEQQCKAVCDKKWADSDFPEKYFCPETLFRPSKFEKYLNEGVAEGRQPRLVKVMET